MDYKKQVISNWLCTIRYHSLSHWQFADTILETNIIKTWLHLLNDEFFADYIFICNEIYEIQSRRIVFQINSII